MSKEERDQLAERMGVLAEQLGEHCESVRIVVTIKRTDAGGGTQLISRGCGNWYAQYGSVKEWILRCEEEVREEERDQDDHSSDLV